MSQQLFDFPPAETADDDQTLLTLLTLDRTIDSLTQLLHACDKWQVQRSCNQAFSKSYLTDFTGRHPMGRAGLQSLVTNPELRFTLLQSSQTDPAWQDRRKRIRDALMFDARWRQLTTQVAETWVVLEIMDGNPATFSNALNHYFESPGISSGQDQPIISIMANTPSGLALLENSAPEIQGKVLAISLDNISTYFHPSLDELRAFAHRFLSENPFPAHAPAHTGIMHYLLLQGAVEEIKAFLEHHDPEKKYFIVHCEQQTVQGNYSAAADTLMSGLASLKKFLKKRKIPLEGIEALFACSALLAAKNRSYYTELKAQTNNGEKNRFLFSFLLYGWVTHLIDGTSPPGIVPDFVQQTEGIDLFFCLQLAYWTGAMQQHRNQWKDITKNLRRYAHANDYHWVAQELDALLERAFKVPRPEPEWHARRGLKPLVEAIPQQEAWERSLEALCHLTPTSENKKKDSAQATRLAWWLVNAYGNQLGIEAREQKISPKGVWSKGKVVSLKRLATERESLPFLTPQDKTLCDQIIRGAHYYGAPYELPPLKALPHLIGHPHIFLNEGEVRVDVVRGEIILTLKQKNEEILVELSPPIPEGSSILWKKETPTRYAVYQVTPDIQRIAQIIGEQLCIPSSAKKQLVEAITGIAPLLPVHSDLPELAAHIPTVAADPILYAHLLPLKDGLRLQWLVRPLPEGSWFAPGKGMENVLGEQEGRPIQAQRDLKQEKHRLKQAMDTCSSLSMGMENAGEWHLEDPQACLEFLSELKTLPEDVVQTVWPEGERFRIKGNRSLSNLRLGLKQQGDWFVASGELELDDGRILHLRQLLELMSQQRGRFLKLGENDWLALSDSFRKRLEELAVVSETSGKNDLRFNRLAAPLLAEWADEVEDFKGDKAWDETVKRLETLQDYRPTLPSTLQAELRDYQHDGFQWLARLAHWGVGACLADDMGLGKTVQTLALLLLRAPDGPALVVAPTSVAMNWISEARRFAPTLNLRLFHNERQLDDLGPFDLVIVSYGLLQQESAQFSALDWHTVVLDEAQAIKNSATKRSQAAMALQARFRVIASGTPVENHLGELWNLFRFINPGLLGSKEHFAERYATPIEQGDKPARLALKKLITPFILRRTKAQVLDELPPRTEITLRVPLSKDEQHLYEAMRQQAVHQLENLEKAERQPIQVLAEITRLRRFCCHPRLVLKDSSLAGSKLAAFAEIVTELLDNRHKALVFSQFVDHLALVREWLDKENIRYQYLDGATPPSQRKERVDAFQRGEGDVFLISLKAGGTGLNLTAADYVIHLDPWWNPAVEDQASDRAHRMGQQRPVTIYRLVAENTIEEQIVALHAEKRDLADSLLEGGDISAKMGADELLALLKTRE